MRKRTTRKDSKKEKIEISQSLDFRISGAISGARSE
jgi:hypothetical protein